MYVVFDLKLMVKLLYNFGLLIKLDLKVDVYEVFDMKFKVKKIIFFVTFKYVGHESGHVYGIWHEV